MDHAYRVTLEYDGEKFALKSMLRVAMRVPRGQSPGDIARNLTGRFVELRGDADELLYRRAVGELIPPTIEYPTGDPDRPFGRAKPPRGATVAVLVPVREGGRKVAIVEAGSLGTAKTRGETRFTSRVLFTVDLPAAVAGQ